MNVFKMATQEAERGSFFFGKVAVFGEAIFFPGGGQRPVAYDENNPEHAKRGPSIKIEFTMIPIDEHDVAFTPQTDCLSFTDEWKNTVWPSIKELGFEDAQGIDGKWAQIEVVRTGRTYKNRDGETKHNTTWKFHQSFNTLKECVAAFHAERGTTPEDEPAMDIDMDSKPAKKAAPAPVANKDTALQFLPTIIAQAQGDIDKLDDLLKSTPIISEMNWTHESEEVAELLSQLVTA